MACKLEMWDLHLPGLKPPQSTTDQVACDVPFCGIILRAEKHPQQKGKPVYVWRRNEGGKCAAVTQISTEKKAPR